jgi:hypothetical protein
MKAHQPLCIFFLLAAVVVVADAAKVKSAPAACIGFDGWCTGAHRTQADCCPNYYCNRPKEEWVYGRCYQIPKNCGSLRKFSIKVFCRADLIIICIYSLQTEDVCEGDADSQGTCCDGYFCFKAQADWAQGRCRVGAPITATGQDKSSTFSNSTTSNNNENTIDVAKTPVSQIKCLITAIKTASDFASFQDKVSNEC